jgi:hypothetical protein
MVPTGTGPRPCARKEALAEIGPHHELVGRRLTALAACSGCDRVVFGVDDGTFAIVLLPWARSTQPDPWPATQRIGGYLALEMATDDHEH